MAFVTIQMDLVGTDGSSGYYAKWHKSGKKRQIQCGFNYMWNLKTKQETDSETETKRMVTRREGMGR